MIRSLCKVHYSLKRHVESLCGIACIILAACEPADEENVDPLYAVDLGLSVKWAWCNVGAERPKEEGNRYAWGDTQPKVGYGSSKSDYAHYNSTMGTYKYLGTDISSTQYDAAHVEMGDDWRMPTKEEIQELKDKCTWEWKTLHENSYYLESDEDYDYHWQSGFLITGPNGNQIFLPEGGYWSGTLESYGVADPKSYMLSANYSEDSSIVACLCYERNFIRPVKGKLNISDDESEKPTSSGGTYTANGVSFKMVGIGKGVFTMGATSEQSSSANSNERPTHQVVLSDYAIGETEVTQALWVAVMGSNPSAFTGNLQRPVEGVSWYECQNFIYKLNQLTGENFRLPTEAEWEYAARGGFNSGRYMYSGSDNLGQVGWYYSNSDFITHAVKSKLPNELGVYDMSGNVSEWCYDWYGGYSSAAQEDPTGPLQGTSRILRGGDYNSLYGDNCRVSYRSYLDPTLRSIGLRLAKSNTTVGVPTGMEAFVLAGEILEVTNSKATISAEVCGTDRELTCGIIYGTTENLSATQGTMVTTTANGEYSVELTGLEPNTYYYYRAFVVVDGEYRYDQGHKFETMRGITIDGVSNITETGATISGVVETGQDVTCGIIYGTTEDLSATNGTMLTITAQGSYAIDLTGLDAGTTYYYCTFMVADGDQYKYGKVCSFNVFPESITYTVNGVSFKMIVIAGGNFTMGSSESDADSDESPSHQVTLSNYMIAETEVTQALWQAVMGSNPSYFTGGLQYPVESVTWDECQIFISKLNALLGGTFRLPTEAEWEYAARGGNFSNGYIYSGSNTIDDVAWHKYNSSSTTHPVKTKSPNELGICDMSGNVWEWCSDMKGLYSSSAQTNPTGSSSGGLRVLRGGGWADNEREHRVSNRSDLLPNSTRSNIGLRLAH